MKKQLNTFWQIYIISSIFVPFMWVINIPIICLILPLYLTWKNIRHFMDLLKKQLKEYSFWINDGLIFFLGTGLSWLAQLCTSIGQKPLLTSNFTAQYKRRSGQGSFYYSFWVF